MGYTHYWEFVKGETKDLEVRYQLAIRQCQRVIRHWNSRVKEIDSESPHRLAGYSAHTKVGKYRGVSLNGTKEFGHESFNLPEFFSVGSNSCKTARKPYDTVVVACLITLKHYLGDNVVVYSDGDSEDWDSGLFLARMALRIKTNNPLRNKKCA